MDYRSKKRLRFMPLLVTILVFGMLLFQAATSLANNNISGAYENHAVTINEDVLTDLKQVAKQKGIPVEEAIARYGWQESFASVAGQLENSFPDQYAGSAIVNDGRGAWIAFKGEVPQTAVDLAATLPVNVRLIGDKGFSKAELKQTLEQAYYAIYNDGDVINAAGGYDIETGVITIEAQPRETPGDAVKRERLRARLQPAQPASKAINIKVSLVDKLEGGVVVNMYGGGYLQDGSTPWCTAGFTVTWLYNYRGISTADHCADDKSSFRYYNHGGNYTNVFRLGRGYNGYNGSSRDVAYYSQGEYTAINQFYYNYGSTRSVTWVGSPQVGQYLCKFGRTTGYGCEAVYQLEVCSLGYCGMTAMKSQIVDHGDSGGPWFWGNTAYGITHGYKPISFIQRTLFTPAEDLPDALGVQVLTSP